MAREMPRPPPRGRGGDVVNLRCGSGARGAAVASGRTPARGGETARAAATRAPSAPRGLRQSVAVFFCFVWFSLLVWPTWRPRHPPHPSKVWVRGQCTGVKAFATAICSPEPCQENIAAFGRIAAPRRAEGGGALLTSGGAAARELPRPPRRGRGRGQFVNVWCHEPKGVCYKAAFCSSCDHLTDEDVGNEAARSTTVQDAQHDRAGQSVAVFLGSSGR